MCFLLGFVLNKLFFMSREWFVEQASSLMVFSRDFTGKTPLEIFYTKDCRPLEFGYCTWPYCYHDNILISCPALLHMTPESEQEWMRIIESEIKRLYWLSVKSLVAVTISVTILLLFSLFSVCSPKCWHKFLLLIRSDNAAAPVHFSFKGFCYYSTACTAPFGRASSLFNHQATGGFK